MGIWLGLHHHYAISHPWIVNRIGLSSFLHSEINMQLEMHQRGQTSIKPTHYPIYSNNTQNVMNGLWWNCQDSLARIQWTIDYISTKPIHYVWVMLLTERERESEREREREGEREGDKQFILMGEESLRNSSVNKCRKNLRHSVCIQFLAEHSAICVIPKYIKNTSSLMWLIIIKAFNNTCLGRLLTCSITMFVGVMIDLIDEQKTWQNIQW